MPHNLTRNMETRKLLLKVADIEKMAGERKVHFLNPKAVSRITICVKSLHL